VKDAELLREFVDAFAKFDEMFLSSDFPGADRLPLEMDGGSDDSQWAYPKWKVAAIHTDAAALTELYRQVPGPLPPLYEQLLLSYRWFEVDLTGVVTLLANPPGPGLLHVAGQISKDPALTDVLFPLGMIPFGRADGGSYDPVCFDTRRRSRDGDCPIIRFEHESILCDSQIGDSSLIADSFRSLIEAVVSKALHRPTT
jgi:hypothetical protein